jgi:hypothetical protein
MNTPDSVEITFAATMLAKPLPNTEAVIQPIPPWVRRALPFTLDADSSGNLNSSEFVPRGRWDSARTAAREFIIGLSPNRPAPKPALTQLELQFA